GPALIVTAVWSHFVHEVPNSAAWSMSPNGSADGGTLNMGAGVTTPETLPTGAATAMDLAVTWAPDATEKSPFEMMAQFGTLTTTPLLATFNSVGYFASL